MTLGGDTPSFQELRDLLEEAASRLEHEAKRRGGYIARLSQIKHKPVAVLGDIHGDYTSFMYALREAEKEGILDNGVIVLLGDYVDRGPPEGQVATIARVASLIINEKPQRIVALRGNHEPPPGLEPIPHDYEDALASLYGLEKASILYKISRRFFDALPHAAIVDNVALFLHGGLPVNGFHLGVNGYLAASKEPWENFVEILWNDPSDWVEEKAPSPRGVGHLFGPKITEKALALTGVKLVVRGHEPVQRGYKTNHEGRVVTLFSRLGPPYYNQAAAMILCSSFEALLDELSECLRLWS